jgi:integrase
MASLQARHSRSCALGRPWTTFADATKTGGCTCTPLYHVVLRHDGSLVREPVGHNRKEAERALDARRGDVARRTYRVLRDIRFDEWGSQWVASLSGKQSTVHVYGHTIGYASRAFRGMKIRDLEPSDIRRFLDLIRQVNAEKRRVAATGKLQELQQRLRKATEGTAASEALAAAIAEQESIISEPPAVAPATLAKHLRQLGACLQAAVTEGYATDNPVRRLSKTARPKVAKSRPAYYTNAELATLWSELAYRPRMAALCRTAVTTGMRFGELAALRWGDVDLLAREVHIIRTYVEGIGEQAPKSNEPRTIDLTPQAAAVLELWFVEAGSPSGDNLVFPREEGGYLAPKYVTQQVLYKALDRAGIPRIGERGRKRDFHSFRHTFARISLEHGAPITWVQKQLGHSSITLTVDTYGSWSRQAEKSEAAKLEGAFPIS